jgi:hypothetical protein
MNMYAYVGGDPVNFTDPSGLKQACSTAGAGDVLVCGSRIPSPDIPVYLKLSNGQPSARGGVRNGNEPRQRANLPAPKAKVKEEEPSASSCAYDAVAEDPAGIGLALAGGAAALLTTKARIAASIAGGTVAVAAMGISAYSKDGVGGVIALVGKGSANASGIAAVGTRFAQGADRAGGWAATAGVLYEGYKAIRRFRDCREGK